jgi:hypothetical protein
VLRNPSSHRDILTEAAEAVLGAASLLTRILDLVEVRLDASQGG